MKIIIVSGNNKGAWEINKEKIIIGRGGSADINLTLDDKVTRNQHAQITYENGKYWLEDMGSKYGTFIGEEKITKKTELAVNVKVKVGNTILVLKENEGINITGSQNVEIIQAGGDVYYEKVDVYKVSTDVLLPKQKESALNDGDERNFCFLSIDVVDHSRFSSEFNLANINDTLIELHKWLNSIITNKKNGKELNWAGDGGIFYFLQEKVTDKAIDNAVSSSMDILNNLVDFNASHNQLKIDIRLRLGIDFGRTIYRKEPGDWYSDALNTAVKIQKMAPPDSVLITQQVYKNLAEQLKNPFAKTSTRFGNQVLYVFPKEKTIDTGNVNRGSKQEDDQEKIPQIILGSINEKLPEKNKEILKKLFLDFDRIKVLRLEAGFGGAELFVVTPTKDNQDIAPLVVKIGEKRDIKEEFEGAQIAKEMLQNFCARIEGNIAEYQGKAGIKYTFAASPLQKIKTFEEFYRMHNKDKILELLNKLFEVLGVGWYNKSNRKIAYFYKEFYSEVLPPDYCIREGSPKEGINPVSDLSTLPSDLRYHWVLLENCQVLQVKEGKIKAKWADSDSIIDYYCQVPHNLNKGDRITISGIISDTRDGIFKTNKSDILANLTAREKEGVKDLPDPCPEINKFLTHTYQTTSPIHHDLNVNNVLIDDFGNPWVIDFAKTTKKGHTAFDFAFFELDIKRHIISEIDEIGLKEFIEIENALYQNNPDSLRLPEQKKAFEVITRLREIADKIINSKDEYSYSLYLCSMATLKFKDASEKANQFAYFSAAFACKSLIGNRWQ